MTSDTQLDRATAPLASVSHQIRPININQTPTALDQSGEASSAADTQAEVPSTNTFEGFGSFSG